MLTIECKVFKINEIVLEIRSYGLFPSRTNLKTLLEQKGFKDFMPHAIARPQGIAWAVECPKCHKTCLKLWLPPEGSWACKTCNNLMTATF